MNLSLTAEMAEPYERMKRKRKTICTSTMKLLTRMEEEVRRDGPDCDKLREMLSVLVIKEGTLIDLDNGVEDEMPMDELEAEIATTPSLPLDTQHSTKMETFCFKLSD